MAIRNDVELRKLLAGVTMAHGGVLPNINPMLLPKRNGNAASTPKSPSKAKEIPKEGSGKDNCICNTYFREVAVSSKTAVPASSSNRL